MLGQYINATRAWPCLTDKGAVGMHICRLCFHDSGLGGGVPELWLFPPKPRRIWGPHQTSLVLDSLLSRTPLTFYVHSCSETADKIFWAADEFDSSTLMNWLVLSAMSHFVVVTLYITANSLSTKCQGTRAENDLYDVYSSTTVTLLLTLSRIDTSFTSLGRPHVLRTLV